MKVISYLNMHRARLGYVNCVLFVAETQLDSAPSLRRRLDTLLFAPVIDGSPVMQMFRQHMQDKWLDDLKKQAEQRARRKSKRSRHGVHEEIVSRMQEPRVYSIADLWLHESAMRSHLGKVLPEDSNEPIELAKDLEFLSNGYALTEVGNLTKLFLQEHTGEEMPAAPDPNPLLIYDNPCIRLLYLHALLHADAVFISFLHALGSGANTDNVLQLALTNLARRFENTARLDEIQDAKAIFKLRDRISKAYASRSSPNVPVEHPVLKAQQVPRLEYCVDLGFLDREEERKGLPRYSPTPALERASIALAGLLEKSAIASWWLDRNFFKAAGTIYNVPLNIVEHSDLKLLYFVRGANFLRRKVGFIPGRMAAMAGCVLAWRDGWKLEIADLFEEVYRVPKGKWVDYLRFSGGSRLDAEFFVTVDKSLQQRLESCCFNS